MKITRPVLGAIAVASLAGVASAQFSQLKFDINGMIVGFTDGANGSGSSLATVSAGGGINFTGSWGLNFGAAAFDDGKIFGNNLTNGAGPFSEAGTATLSSVDGFLNFQNGSLVDGSFQFGVSTGDSIQGTFAPFGPGGSSISGTLPGGPWFVSGFVVDATFTDVAAPNIFGDNVDISQFVGQIFGGTFSEIFLADNGTNGDLDMIIQIPAPGSVALSIAAVGLIASRRRRA